MKPAPFPESNRTLDPPDGKPEIAPLSTWTDGEDSLSRWRPSFTERVKLLFGASIWVWVKSGQTQPPICLTVERSPFKSEEVKP